MRKPWWAAVWWSGKQNCLQLVLHATTNDQPENAGGRRRYLHVADSALVAAPLGWLGWRITHNKGCAHKLWHSLREDTEACKSGTLVCASDF
jgi:hypothetical protein